MSFNFQKWTFQHLSNIYRSKYYLQFMQISCNYWDKRFRLHTFVLLDVQHWTESVMRIRQRNGKYALWTVKENSPYTGWLYKFSKTYKKRTEEKYREDYDPSNNTGCDDSQYFLLGKFFLMVQFGEYPHLNKSDWSNSAKGWPPH